MTTEFSENAEETHDRRVKSLKAWSKGRGILSSDPAEQEFEPEAEELEIFGASDRRELTRQLMYVSQLLPRSLRVYARCALGELPPKSEDEMSVLPSGLKRYYEGKTLSDRRQVLVAELGVSIRTVQRHEEEAIGELARVFAVHLDTDPVESSLSERIEDLEKVVNRLTVAIEKLLRVTFARFPDDPEIRRYSVDRLIHGNPFEKRSIERIRWRVYEGHSDVQED